MGRNDTSRMESVHGFCIFSIVIIRIAVFSIIILMLSVINTSAQKKGVPSEEPKERARYNLQLKFPALVYNVYKFTEETKVSRTYSDSSKRDYYRKITYFFTQFAPDNPEKSFSKIRVSIDSMLYYFKEGESVLEFNSQDESFPKKSFLDLMVASVVLGKEFEITYSPYGDIAKLGGESIDETIKFIYQFGPDKMDTLNKFFWMKGLSQQHLKYICDLSKGLIPQGKVYEDSVWHSPFIFELNGVDFIDTLNTKVISYSAGICNVNGTAANLTAYPQQARLYDIGELVNIINGKATGAYDISFNVTGFIKEASAHFKGNLVLMIKKERVDENIQTDIKWELLNKYKW
ncbi:MAG: hypothetical protein QG635_1835 [Bacteroidota bacterium]|nr:hypothetical protein [Bacteroidota bacterium]